MKRSTRITTVVAVVAVAGLVALAAPAAIGAVSWASERFGSTAPPAPTVTATTPTPSTDLVDLGDGISVPAGGPGDCTTNSRINIGSDDGTTMYAKLLGETVEMGPSELASGPVTFDDDGEIFSYAVQPGDSLIAIGERFCIDYVTVGMLNHVRGGQTIHPGDILYLRPDPAIPFVDPYVPYNAEPGSSTIAYYDGVVELANDVASGDLGAARLVWDRLAAHMPPETAALVSQALSDDDLSLLRRMFP